MKKNIMYLCKRVSSLKVSGSFMISVFLAFIAYKQYKISKEQTAIYKQQAEIARITVALNVRDKKYDVMRRWNETYHNFISDLYSKNLLDFDRSYGLLSAVSDELYFSFKEIPNIHMKLELVRSSARELLLFRREFVMKYNVDLADFKSNASVSLELEDKYYQDIQSKIDLLDKHRNQLLSELAKEVNISNFKL